MGDAVGAEANGIAQPNFGDYYQSGEVKVTRRAVVLSNDARNMEIKAYQFHDLPRYCGIPNEDLVKFLKECDGLVRMILISDKV